MRINPEKMYSRFAASDASWNGRFFAGVTTTGVYCLPSCHARKALPGNVRFFPTCEAAREAGFRPCLRCHPDDYARGSDPVLEATEALVREIRAEPSAFANARAVVRRSGFGPTRCFELFRQHYHATPADVLLAARLQAARTLLANSGRKVSDVASDAGFDSLSSFHEHFRARAGMTPAAYRELRRPGPFTLDLPQGFCLGHLLRTLGRDPRSLNERLAGSTYETVLELDGSPSAIRVEFSQARARVSLMGARPGSARAQFDAHSRVAFLLGLDQDSDGFVRLARRLGLSRLVAGRHGLRLARTAGVLDGLLWCIIGQQINLPFAYALKRRLVELAGEQVAGGLWALPSAGRLAELSPDALRPLQFSRRKSEYLIGAARLAADGVVDLAALPLLSATRAERTLLAVRGLGPWSVNYLMMRALGFADCVPLGDTGVSSGLRTLFRLEERPDADATLRLMSVFSPHRSLATAHLWQINQPAP